MNVTAHGHVNDPNEGEINLSDLLTRLIENKWLILAITMGFLSLGGYYASRQIPQYQSDVIMQVEENRSSTSGVLGNFATNIQLGGGRNTASTAQAALIKSRYILEPVCKTLGLDIKAHPKQNIFMRLFSPSHDKIKIQALTVPYELVNKPLLITYDKPNHVALYDSHNNLLLQGNTNTLLMNQHKNVQLKVGAVEATLGASFRVRKNSTMKAVEHLKQQIKIEDIGKKDQVGILSISLHDANPNQVVKILDEIARVTEQKSANKKAFEASKSLQFLHHELPLVKQSLEHAEMQLNHYRAQSGKIDIKLQTETFLKELADLDKKLAELKFTKIDMQDNYTAEHPMLIALNKQIKETQHDRKRLEKQLKTLPESDQVAVNLMLDVEIKTSLYTTLLNKIQELEVVKAGMVSDVRILSYAKLPDDPIPIKKGVIYLASLLLGLVVSTLVIIARTLLFARVDDPHWAERHFNMMNLAIIPYSKEQHDQTHSIGANKKNIPLLAQASPRSLSIESLRSLRTSLQLTLTCASNNIISILGVSPNVGKSFVSANLSYLLATAGKRVLIIDADLRKGTIHKYFNLTPSIGFSDLLSGTKTTEEVLKNSGHDNLTVITRGDYPSDPSELLASTQCKLLLENLSKAYDFVIIDTAPILLVTDAVLIGAISATNYLVLGSGVHQPADIEMAVKRLANAGVTVNGSIFNFHNAASSKNAYYYKYYSYNAYYEDPTIPTQSKKKKRKERAY